MRIQGFGSPLSISLLLVCASLAASLAASCSSGGAGSSGSGSSGTHGLTAENQRVWQAAQSHNGTGPLDGRVFAVDLGEKGKPADQREVFEFAGGRFHSRNCDEFGFGTGAYASGKNGDATTFQASCTNEDGARNDWHGSVRGANVEGGFTLNMPGKDPVEYWFRGSETKP